MLPAQPNESLIDGLACLQALAVHGEPIGSRALARMLNLDHTRTNRLLKTLAHLGLAQQDSRRKYRAGPGLHVLAVESLHGSGLIHRSMKALEQFHGCGHVVAMGVLWRDRVCYLYHRPPRRSATDALQHKPHPATESGLGMALLAHQPESEVRELYEVPVDQHSLLGKRPELDGPDGLFNQLDRIREQGYALIKTNATERTLAIVVGDPPYAAVGFAGQFPDSEVEPLVADLHRAADEIEAG